MTGFLRSLFSGDEREADSVITAGFIALAVMLGLTVYAAIRDYTTFNPLNFCTGAGALIAAIAGAKAGRDHWSPPTQGGQQQ